MVIRPHREEECQQETCSPAASTCASDIVCVGYSGPCRRTGTPGTTANRFCKSRGAQWTARPFPWDGLSHSVMLSLLYITNNLFVTARTRWHMAAGQQFGLWQFTTHLAEAPSLYCRQTAVATCSHMPAQANGSHPGSSTLYRAT